MSRLHVTGCGIGARHAGFSLIELLIVLAVLGMLIGAVIRPVRSQLENRVLAETQRVLDESREALLGYVVAKGHFPCPADTESNGHEAAGADHDIGACPVWYGFLPAASLGMTSIDAQGYAVDGGRRIENRIRYAVSNQTIVGITNPFTRRSGMRSVGVASLDAEDLLFVCSSGGGVNAGVDCGTATTLTSRAAAMIWSVGENAATGGNSIHEAQNPNPNGGSADRVFVSRSRSIAEGTEFDDLVTWIPITVVVNRVIVSGQLP